ncbi:MAG TPA: nodulation protein NfeD [Burkholderiales bacterium]|nr:nodulation protein NfeD [Burkholderiales bacterium]
MRPQPAFVVRLLIAWIALLALLFATASSRSSAPGEVIVIELDGAVSPASADYAVRGIRKAADKGAALVVLKLDTPGGLDKSMRSIIKAILASAVPVATYVAPDGARAASAGTYILYASHIAAMAPATNLGAATPVAIGIGGDEPGKLPDKDAKDKKGRKGQPSSGDSMRAKQINDAAAYIRSLAEMRGRNAQWAEKAVRESVSLSAAEARKLKVIDFVATDLADLLKQVDGRKVTAAGAERTLQTAGAKVTDIEPDWRTRLLMVVTDPSVALILMMIGIYGLIFEFMNPGFVLPGVAGGICLLIALYAFQLLPINYAGIALILLGLAFVVAEAFMPSFGALGIGGVAALAIGMVILIDPEEAPGFDIPLSFIAGFTALMALAVFATVYLALKSRSGRIVSGREDLRGADGLVIGDFEAGEGWARVKGETWRVRSDAPLKQGDHVRVTAVSGLTLTVEKT